MATLRPLLDPLVRRAAEDLPPELQGLADVHELLDAVIIENATNGKLNMAQLELICRDAQAASELQEIVERGIEFARVMLIGEAKRSVQGEGRLPDAQRALFHPHDQPRGRPDQTGARQRSPGVGDRSQRFDGADGGCWSLCCCPRCKRPANPHGGCRQ